ncbi:sensor histidine kinase (plasmid) [Streptomyces sp. HUAS TT11]|uniref:sensor histidine kinase n=1 Tax=Streptomyces sp. HUAS TT11 TaxID=3447508 RepID=UPI003F65FEFE
MLEQIRLAVAVPLASVAVLLAAAVAWAWAEPMLSTGRLLGVLAWGTVASVLMGAWRARVAATAVHREREAAWAVELQKITDAVMAVDKLLLWTADELCRGQRPPIPDWPGPAQDPDGAARVVGFLEELQVQAAASLVRVHEESQAAVLLGMLRHFSRREHALVDRALDALTELQMQTDDPQLLARIYEIDHLVTRMRRLVESKAVLGGESLRSTRKPMTVTTMLRGAVSEVMQYARVGVSAGAAGAEFGLPGHVGPDLSHLLAELIENGIEFSGPDTRVQVRAERVAAGLAVEIEDRAMPMTARLRARLNALLSDPGTVDVSAQVREGHIGLLTAAKIAQRHGMSVMLRENPMGSTTALVVVPQRQLVAIRPPAVVRTAASTPAGEQYMPDPPPLITPPENAPDAQAKPAVASASVYDAGADAEAPPLPRRTPAQIAVRAEQSQTPVTAARAGLAAAFLGGRQAARAQNTDTTGPQTAAGDGQQPSTQP